jgi:hypothetical protein
MNIPAAFQLPIPPSSMAEYSSTFEPGSKSTADTVLGSDRARLGFALMDSRYLDSCPTLVYILDNRRFSLGVEAARPWLDNHGLGAR